MASQLRLIRTREVMVSELVAGERFDAFCAAASQDERNRAGASIVEFVVTSCRDGFFNSDPNPGNFLFHSGKVHCIDFGSTKSWPEPQRRLWRDLIVSGMNQDKRLYTDTLKKMGIAADPRQFDFDEAFQSLIESGLMGYTSKVGPTSVPVELVRAEVVKLFSRSSRNGRLRDLPPDFVMGFRVYLGHLALVARLQAEVDWGLLVRRIMT